MKVFPWSSYIKKDYNSSYISRHVEGKGGSFHRSLHLGKELWQWMNAKRIIINFTWEWALLLIVQCRRISPETTNTNNKKRLKYTHTYIHTHIYVTIIIKEKEAIGLRGHEGDWTRVPGKGWREKKRNTETQEVI